MEEKKKLLYVVRYPLGAGFHLKQKFDGQLNAFANLDFDVYYIGFDKKYFYLVNVNHKKVIGKTRFWIPNYFHTILYQDYYRIAIKVMKETRFDYVYYRSCSSWPSTKAFAKQIQREKSILLTEVPTYLANSEEHSQSFLRKIYSRLSYRWGKCLLNATSLFLLIGDPAPKTYMGKPAMNLYNGVSLQIMPLRNPVHDSNCVHLLALSSMCYWHGYDRLIRSLAEYSGSMPVQIHMVGGNDGGCLEEWKQLALDLGVSNQVVFHGEKYGKELDALFDLCDVGINSMGMYRKGIDSTSELKTREYVTRGLPFVSSVTDASLNLLENDVWLKISNDDGIPFMQEIVSFAMAEKEKTDIPNRLREYACEHMSWESQYNKVFAKIEERN